MARMFHTNAETLVKVRGSVGASYIKDLSELGLTSDAIRISINSVHEDVKPDDFGGRPAELMYALADATIDMTLIHYDPVILDECLRLSMGGAPAIGQNPRAGTTMGGNVARFVPGNNYIGLNIASPVALKPYRFYYAFLAGRPHSIPLGTEKKKQIAYMPRKHVDEAQQVFGWLHFSGALDGWEVVAIDGLSERDTSKILQESAVFFQFGYPEGGTLPPFEAMACGCVVVGYGGFSSDELLTECGGYRAPSADTTLFFSYASKILRMPWNDLLEWGVKSAELTLKRLSLDSERDALLTAMQEMGI